jgi:hypothetical protein
VTALIYPVIRIVTTNKQKLANHKTIPQPTQLMEPKRLKFPNIMLPKAMQHTKRLPATRENPE